MARIYVDNKGYRRFADSKKLVSRWIAAKKKQQDYGNLILELNEDELEDMQHIDSEDDW